MKNKVLHTILKIIRDIYIDFLVFIIALIILVKYTYDQRSLVWWVYLCAIVVSLALWIKARIDLGNSFSVTPQAHTLVTRGLYGRIRHPIYLFSTTAAAFWSLMAGTWYWIALVMLLVILQIWRAKKEEQKMLETFGEQYLKYKERTWL